LMQCNEAALKSGKIPARARKFRRTLAVSRDFPA
jgi:hypothetical protein